MSRYVALHRRRRNAKNVGLHCIVCMHEPSHKRGCMGLGYSGPIKYIRSEMLWLGWFLDFRVLGLEASLLEGGFLS